jgi:archaellum component FlaC
MQDNFDLKKFLVENKLTTNSKLVNEQADHVSPMVVKAEEKRKREARKSIDENTQSELDKWEGRLYDLENMTRSSNNPDPIKQKKAIEGVKKKIASLKKKIK